MKYKVIVYYDNMPDSEHIFNNKKDAINELHRLRGVKYHNSRMYTVEMVEVVEDVEVPNVSKYKYEINYNPKMWVPVKLKNVD